MDQQFKQKLEELARESRAAEKIDRERAELFAVLVKSKGWELYVELLNGLMQSRADALMLPATSIESILGQEHIKGALSGLLMARDLPSVIMGAIAVPATSEDETS